MKNKAVLIVDDEPKIRILLKDFLLREGFAVIEAQDGKEALEVFYEHKAEICLIILDVMLPVYDGWTVCREIRKVSDVPVMMLTARTEDFDEVHGFEIGADDYITKPVKPTALMARIQALFRRMEKTVNPRKSISYKGLEIDDASHIVRLDGKEISLSPKEYLLLYTLLEQKGKVISREDLLSRVWNYDYFGGLRTVDTHINRLRMKLGRLKDSITTIRGFGYRFED